MGDRRYLLQYRQVEGQPQPRIVTVRPLLPVDRDGVRILLAGLPDLYPGAELWLEDRLARLADFWVLTIGERVVGTWVESPKPDGRLKISNMYVAREHRGEGLGRVMADQAASRWSIGTHHTFYVTVGESSLAGVAGLLGPYGFRQEAVIEDRYLPGSAEIVLSASREDLIVDPPLPEHSIRF